MSFVGMLSKLPLIGNLFPSDEAEAHKANLTAASQAYSAYRPEIAQASMNALGNSMAAYQGLNNYLAAKYGAGTVPQPIIANPLSPRAMSIGNVSPYQRGGTLEDIGGGALAGAGTVAPVATQAGPYAPLVLAGGALFGSIGGAANRGTVTHDPYGPFKTYQTYPTGRK